MDIHLSDGIVFDTLAAHKVEVPIIFTTAYDQYAIKAFKQNSIDYLLKPIDEDELDSAIAKLKKSLPQVDLAALSALLSQQQTTSTPTYKERISVKVGDKIRSIQVSEVKFFYSADKSNFLYNSDGRSYPIDYTMEQLYKLLDPNKFYRVSRGHIVNIETISDVIADFKEWLG